MSIDTMIAITNRQKPAMALFALESVPVVGAIASIPGVLMSLAISVSKASQAAFNEIRARWNGPEEIHYQKQAVLLQDAADWGIIFLNQVANLCTAGILNNIGVHIALYRLQYEDRKDL